MPTKRLFAAPALAGALLTSLPLFAEPLDTPSNASAALAPNLMGQLAVFAPAASLTQAALPAQASAPAKAKPSGWAREEDDLDADGMPADAVFAAAFGPSQPVASNDAAAGRALNRRVELSPTPRPRREAAKS